MAKSEKEICAFPDVPARCPSQILISCLQITLIEPEEKYLSISKQLIKIFPRQTAGLITMTATWHSGAPDKPEGLKARCADESPSF